MGLIEEAVERVSVAWNSTIAVTTVLTEHHERAVFETRSPHGPVVVKVDTSMAKHRRRSPSSGPPAMPDFPSPPSSIPRRDRRRFSFSSSSTAGHWTREPTGRRGAMPARCYDGSTVWPGRPGPGPPVGRDGVGRTISAGGPTTSEASCSPTAPSRRPSSIRCTGT